MGLIRSMLKDKSLPLELWGEAINTLVYVLNRSSTKSLQGKTPYEMWSGKKFKLSHLRIFCSIVHVKTPGTLGNLKIGARRWCLWGTREVSRVIGVLILPLTRSI